MPLFRRKPKPRHDQRILVRQDVTITPSDTGLPFDAVTGNVSISGMFVPTLAPLPPESEFSFDLALGHQAVHGRARVVWMREFEDGPERPAGMGVTFLEIAGQGERLLAHFIDAHVQAGATVQVGAVAIDPQPGSLESALRSPPPHSVPPPRPAPRPTASRPSPGLLGLAVVLVLAILGGGVFLAPHLGALLRAVLGAPRGDTSQRVASQMKRPPMSSDPSETDALAPPTRAAREETLPEPTPAELASPPDEPVSRAMAAPAASPGELPPVDGDRDRRPTRPPLAAPQSFSGVESIVVRRDGADLVVSLLTDGPLPRWDHLRLDANRPREVIRLYGVSRAFPRNLLPVGEAELRQIRTGYHEDSAGDQLHVVLDLTGPDVRLVATEEQPLRLDLHLRREHLRRE